MKNSNLLLRASIAAAIMSSFACTCDVLAGQTTNSISALDTTEAARIVETVNNVQISPIQGTHLKLADSISTTVVNDNTALNHMQLVLHPSALRSAELQNLISEQHDPSSNRFHSWISPEQYGKAFGVVDSDINAVTAWLISQGFKVNDIYPNKTQIDFSGTAGQIQRAFHTQEVLYAANNGEQRLANTTDISVPTALQPVIAGVIGLNSPRSKASSTPIQTATLNAGTHTFSIKQANVSGSHSSAVPISTIQGAVRGLVPNDLAEMYGISKIRSNGVTGKGITIALIEDDIMQPNDWTNFVDQFDLARFGGTFKVFNPAPPTGPTNCYDLGQVFGTPNLDDSTLAILDAEWATAIAPGANIEIANCAIIDPNFNLISPNFYLGTFVAATNLINANARRPDIITTVDDDTGEKKVDAASKTAVDLMWAQADAEGISIFSAAGDAGTNPSFYGEGAINGAGIEANAMATSPNVTAVGGTDTADTLDGTTSKYFSPTSLDSAYGTALGYVPEIPWNTSCGNGVAALAKGFSSAPAFCSLQIQLDPNGYYLTSLATSGGPSSVDSKPTWQRLVYNAAPDQSRDVPDVALFAGSYNNSTAVIVCDETYPCTPGFTAPVDLGIGSTSLATSMFAGIQALIDQGIAMRGLPADQGNAAPTLYALAAQEYGGPTGQPPTTLSACGSDNGNNGTASCVFHNITRGSISTECYQIRTSSPTPDCYFFATSNVSPNRFTQYTNVPVGLTSTSSTQYGPQYKAYSAQPGWSFASGLGSVNATNLLIAWRAFVHAPAAAPSP